MLKISGCHWNRLDYGFCLNCEKRTNIPLANMQTLLLCIDNNEVWLDYWNMRSKYQSAVAFSKGLSTPPL